MSYEEDQINDENKQASQHEASSQWLCEEVKVRDYGNRQRIQNFDTFFQLHRRMQIQLIKNPDGFTEHMLIELQGTIENDGRPLAGQILGTLVWRKDNSEALLLLGHHLLEGKISELDKPFLILRPSSLNGNLEERTMVVEAVIKRRLLFKNRPKPLVLQ